MKFLALSENYPMWDRASGELRYFQLLKALASHNEVVICGYDAQRESNKIGAEETARYRRDIQSAGVRVFDSGVLPLLRQQRFDAVLFEYHIPAIAWLDDVRYLQPEAVSVIDTVDVQFRRLFSKAALTGRESDRAEAERMKREELDIYSRADATITVTEEDRQALAAELPDAATFTIPNIHPMPSLPVVAVGRLKDSLIFVGTFKHPPNADAMLHFAKAIFPLVLERHPGARLRIVGNAPTEEIRALASDRIEVLGYVPETAPYLLSSSVSIAPLRFGAGIKGKIGEAMSYGLPVVTTSIGADGFGFDAGVHAFVADEPDAFADRVVQLLRDEVLRERIGMAGREFIRTHFSEEAVGRIVDAFVRQIPGYSVKRISATKRLQRDAVEWVGRNLAWRVR